MKKILLPTDFSENSWNAIAYALQLFKNEICEFYLLNAYTPVIYHVEYVLVNAAKYGLGDAVRENALKNLDDFKDRMTKSFTNPKHTIKTIAAFNTLVSEIKEIVEKKKIDYVVMGTKGATGAAEVLFGSNTVHVFKNVNCPILAVPDAFDFETPHEVLFPTDYEIEYKDYHLKPLLDISSLFNTRVNILNVSKGYDLSEAQETHKQVLEKKFEHVTHLFHRVNSKSVAEAITQFQLKSRINLLVMINNKHSFFQNLFFKSTINQIGFHLNIPFLVIPIKSIRHELSNKP